MTTRLARFLTSLYPHRWRERYEQEFLQFLQEHPLTVHAVFNVIGSALYQRIHAFRYRRSIFSRYTQRARRSVFFARHEAQQFGSNVIEPEHLLLGVLRESSKDPGRFFADSAAVQTILHDVRARVTASERKTLSENVSLSSGCKRILRYAQEEAARLNDRVGREHLLIGIVREEETDASGILRKNGLNLAAMRERLDQLSPRNRQE